MVASKQVKAVNLRLREEKEFIKKLIPVFESLLNKKVVTTKWELIAKLNNQKHKVGINTFYLEFNNTYNYNGYITLNSYVQNAGANVVFLTRIEDKAITNLDYIKGLASTKTKQYTLKEVQKSIKIIEKSKLIIEKESGKIKPFLYL